MVEASQEMFYWHFLVFKNVQRRTRCRSSEVWTGVTFVAHLDVDVWCDSSVDLLHGQHGAEWLALRHGTSGFNRLNVEQLEAQTCKTKGCTWVPGEATNKASQSQSRYCKSFMKKVASMQLFFAVSLVAFCLFPEDRQQKDIEQYLCSSNWVAPQSLHLPNYVHFPV